MSRRRPLPKLLLAAALATAWCAPALAEDEMTPRPQRVFAEKPRIEDYADYSNFLVDIMEYRRQKDAQAAAAAEKPAAIPPPVAEDPLLYSISGPESLDEALRRAKRMAHPSYAEPERYGRTTASSFPMPAMEGKDLSTNEIQGNLADLEAVNPEGYDEQGDEMTAAGQIARNPTRDRVSREETADQEDSPPLSASWDESTRILTGSDGQTYWIPVYVENEVGYTIIRRLDIEVR